MEILAQQIVVRLFPNNNDMQVESKVDLLLLHKYGKVSHSENIEILYLISSGCRKNLHNSSIIDITILLTSKDITCIKGLLKYWRKIRQQHLI